MTKIVPQEPFEENNDEEEDKEMRAVNEEVEEIENKKKKIMEEIEEMNEEIEEVRKMQQSDNNSGNNNERKEKIPYHSLKVSLERVRVEHFFGNIKTWDKLRKRLQNKCLQFFHSFVICCIVFKY